MRVATDRRFLLARVELRPVWHRKRVSTQGGHGSTTRQLTARHLNEAGTQVSQAKEKSPPSGTCWAVPPPVQMLDTGQAAKQQSRFGWEADCGRLCSPSLISPMGNRRRELPGTAYRSMMQATVDSFLMRDVPCQVANLPSSRAPLPLRSRERGQFESLRATSESLRESEQHHSHHSISPQLQGTMLEGAMPVNVGRIWEVQIDALHISSISVTARASVPHAICHP